LFLFHNKASCNFSLEIKYLLDKSIPMMQIKYILDLLHKTHMVEFSLSSSPIAFNCKLSKLGAEMVGVLQYVTLVRL